MMSNDVFVIQGVLDEANAVVPTGLLRWKAGVLQQEFAVQHYRRGQIERASKEWRGVPHVEDDDA